MNNYNFLAKFMDLKLRTGNKECSEEELDAVMDKVIVLFRFIQGFVFIFWKIILIIFF